MLEGNPALRQKFDINTTAEVGTSPAARNTYQALTLDRAAARGESLPYTLSRGPGTPDPYYPGTTANARTASGQGVSPALWGGANPANYGTGNASFDPKTGRWVGFAGGPQTGSVQTGSGTENTGIEGPDLAAVRRFGYQGPSKTAIGPGGPQGVDAAVASYPEGAREKVGTGDEGKRTGQAGPGAGLDAGTGQVGRKIPGLAKPAPTFAQRLAQDPFWQFGTALMAKPGLKRYPLQGVGAAAQTMSAQQTQERNRILDEKPQMFDDGKQLHVLHPDGTLTPTGMPSPKAGSEARATAEDQRKAEKHEREMEGDSVTVKGLWGDQRYGWNKDTKKYDIPLDVAASTPQPATPKIEQPAAPPVAPPAAPPASAPQVRQTEAAPPAWQRAATTDPRITGQPFHTDADLSSFPPQSRPAAPTQTAQAPQTAQSKAGQAGPGAAAPQSAETVPDEEKDTVAQLRRSGGFKTPLDTKRYDPRMLQYFNKTPEDFDFLAGRLALGDTSVLQGYGNSKQAAVFKSGLRSRADQYYTDRGLGPEQANAAVAFNMAQKAGARSLATQEARISGALGTAMQTAPRVIETSEKVDRTKYPDLNKIILAAKQKTGDENVVRFGLAIETFVNNYARAMGGGNNVMTDAARDQAHIFLQNNYAKGQINAAIDQALIEMDSELTGVRRAMPAYLGQTPETAYKPGDVFKGRVGQQPGQQGQQPGAAQPQAAPRVRQNGHIYERQPDGSYKATD
jgi:hypothetical protein